MHEEILTDDQRVALALLAELGVLRRTYLVGGTATALHAGHRLSIDFDLFSADPPDSAELAEKLRSGPLPLTILLNKPNTLQGELNNVKFAFVQYPYPLIAPTHEGPNGMVVAGVEDLVAMKLVAISQRGSRKDFIDFYFLTTRWTPLEEVFALLPRKFAGVAFEPFHLIRALQYFDDAERQAMPRMLVPFEWEECKAHFRRVVPPLARKLFGRE